MLAPVYLDSINQIESSLECVNGCRCCSQLVVNFFGPLCCYALRKRRFLLLIVVIDLCNGQCQLLGSCNLLKDNTQVVSLNRHLTSGASLAFVRAFTCLNTTQTCYFRSPRANVFCQCSNKDEDETQIDLVTRATVVVFHLVKK